MALNAVVLVLTASGVATARHVATALGAELHGRAERLADAADVYFPDTLRHVQDLFAAGRPIVGVCAAGILIRAVAPLLADKRWEPPVLAVAEDGSAVVPLLGGHRGANALAVEIAEALSVMAAITTAGDLRLGVALDAPPEGWTLGTPDLAPQAMAKLLGGAGAQIGGDVPAEWLAPLPSGNGVEIDARISPPRPDVLTYHPECFALGVGASRDCPPDEMIDLVDKLLADGGVAAGSLKAVYTVDLKEDEPAVLALAKHLARPLRLFSARELEAETPRTANPSDVVFAEIGSHGVAENAALAGAGPEAELTIPKRKSAHATVALARASEPILELRGRSRGHLAIVGIGPGQSAWRTPEASALIGAADELVGYTLYLDLLGPIAARKARADFPLGSEEDRCRYALEQAAAGRRIALISSGDAGIYAMGALVFELLDRPADQGGVSASARRVEVVTAPGISALQAASARAGAPLGHDFCAISLSDLLTPRATILQRLRAAAEGDFVTALYNPVSKRRRILLDAAREILLAHRPPETPVLLATSLGRPEEKIRYRSLATLATDEVDMLTVVLVGSSQSRLAKLGEGPRMYTPRGYAKKIDGGCP